MHNIIQIEELVYGRLPHVSKADWIAMLTEHGAHADYTTFKNDNLLIEQSDYRFSNGKMISSERIVYNIDYLTYDTARNAPAPENTTEKVTTRYEEKNNRYFVYCTHYLKPKEEIALEDIYAEADMPINGIFHQAQPETKTDTPKPIDIQPKAVVPKPQQVEHVEPSKQQQQTCEISDGHSVGDAVFHKKFGKGIILSIDERYVCCRFGTDLIKKFQNPQAFEQGFLE